MSGGYVYRYYYFFEIKLVLLLRRSSITIPSLLTVHSIASFSGPAAFICKLCLCMYHYTAMMEPGYARHVLNVILFMSLLFYIQLF